MTTHVFHLAQNGNCSLETRTRRHRFAEVVLSVIQFRHSYFDFRFVCAWRLQRNVMIRAFQHQKMPPKRIKRKDMTHKRREHAVQIGKVRFAAKIVYNRRTNVCVRLPLSIWIVSCSRKQPEQLRAHVTYSSCVHVSSDVAASLRFRCSERRIFCEIGPKFHPTNSPMAEFSRNSVKCHEFVIIYQSIYSSAGRKINENDPKQANRSQRDK